MNTTPFSFKKLIYPLTSLKAIHIIIIMGLIVYSNSFLNNFILDDYGLILRNPSAHSISTIPNLFLNRTGAQLTTDYYRPLPATVYAVIYTFSQENVFFYHLVQTLFHITNGIFIFLIFKSFLKKELSLFLSLLFLVHPLNSETVVYISALQDAMFVTFGLLSLILVQKKPGSFKHISTAYFSLLFCLLSKETGFLFIPVIWGYSYLVNRKVMFPHVALTASIGMLYTVMRLIANISVSKHQLVPIMSMPLMQRMINVPEIILYYLMNFLYPKDIVALHSWVISKTELSTFYLPLFVDTLFFIGILFLLFKIRTRENEKKLAIFFVLWFLLGIGFHLQIFPLDLTVSDRYFYFPMIGLLGFIGVCVQKIKLPHSKVLPATMLGVLLLLVFSIRTVYRNADWKNLSTLLEHDHKTAKNDYLLEFLYGYNLYEHGKYDEAYTFVQTAITLYPQSYKAWNVLGAIYYEKGDIAKARSAFSTSLSINPNYAVQENMALLLLKHDDTYAARDFIKKSTETYPNSEKLWFYLLVAENKTGNDDSALNAAKHYYLLKKDQESYTLYTRILNREKFKIEVK